MPKGAVAIGGGKVGEEARATPSLCRDFLQRKQLTCSEEAPRQQAKPGTVNLGISRSLGKVRVLAIKGCRVGHAFNPTNRGRQISEIRASLVY